MKGTFYFKLTGKFNLVDGLSSSQMYKIVTKGNLGPPTFMTNPPTEIVVYQGHQLSIQLPEISDPDSDDIVTITKSNIGTQIAAITLYTALRLLVVSPTAGVAGQ